MQKNASSERRFLLVLVLVGLLFPPGLFLYTCYLLFASAFAGDMTGERLVTGLFLMAVALFGAVAWAGALMAVFGG